MTTNELLPYWQYHCGGSYENDYNKRSEHYPEPVTPVTRRL